MKFRRNKKGFTIVELVIVIGVIGILSAILIPTFVNVTQKANAAALQSNLANAYSAYTSEAADGEVDGVYSTNAENAPLATIEFKGQDEVVLELDGTKYEFDGKWIEYTTAPGALVVGASEHYYSFDGSAYTEISGATRESLSTFNKAIVYVK